MIEKKLSSFPGVRVEPCLWGDTYGARLNANGLSIPTYDTARTIEEYQDDDNYTALWELLYSDPLCELRAINVDKNEKVPFHPVEISPGEKFEYEIRNHKYSSTFIRKLQDVELDNVFEDALKSVINSEPFKTAVNFNPDALIDDYSIITRAITAKASILVPLAFQSRWACE